MKRYLANGFTLIEVVITLAIIVVVFSVAIARTDRVNSGTSLNITSNVLISDLRSTAMSALNNEQFQLQTPTGWGVQIVTDTDPTSYTVFADLNGDLAYQNNEKFKTVSLTKDVKFSYTSFKGEGIPSGALVFRFTRGNEVFFNGVKVDYDSGHVFITLEDEVNNETKYIPVNPLGVVNPEGPIAP